MDIKKEILTAIKVFMGFALLLGLVYPLLITGIAQITMPYQANGSLIEQNNIVTGSELIGQKFNSPKYFHSRPSAVDYNAESSGGSNLGPSSQKLFDRVSMEVKKIRKENSLDENQKIPADAVLTSASGLDPDISIENAYMQIPRITKERKLSATKIEDIVKKNTSPDFIGVWGQNAVNVLKLNIELDKISGK